MGSFCSSSTTSTTTIPASVLQQYQNVINQANDVVSNNPYQAYTGQLTAGLNSTQNQAISGLGIAANVSQPYSQLGSAQSAYGFDVAASASPYYQNAASTINSATPYFTQAGQMATNASGPVNATQYMSPYTQSVVDTTLANINRSNAIQQNDLTSKAIQNGVAFGGDRAGLASAELARNQDMSRDQTIAQLFNSGYGQSLSAAEQDASRQGQLAQTLGGLGSATVGAGTALNNVGNSVTNQGQTISGIGTQQAGIGAQASSSLTNAYNSLMSAGTQAQSTDQSALNAAYQQYENKTSYPYQQVGWLSNISTGIGSGSGSTTSGTSTPSLFSLLARGGAVPHRANGGSVTDRFPVAGGPIDLTGTPGGSGLIPTVTINQGSVAKGQPQQGDEKKGQNSSPNLFGQIQKGVGNLSNAYNAIQSLGSAIDTGAGVAGATGDVLASLAAFRNGGAVDGFAQGGVPYIFSMPYSTNQGLGGIPGGAGLIPNIRINKASILSEKAPTPQDPLGSQSNSQKAKDVKNGLSAVANFFSNNQSSPAGATSAVENVNNFSGGRGSLYARGGQIGHYDDGGGVDFVDRWAPVDQALSDDVFVPGKMVTPTPVHPKATPRQDDVINPNDPFRLDGTYDGGAPLTEAQAAARYRGDDGLGAIANATRNDPEAMPADVASYNGAPGGGAGLGGMRSMQAPQGLASLPNLSRPDGNAPAPGILGSLGLSRDGANAVLSGLAGFLSASGNGGLLQGIGRGIAGAQGSLAEAEAERQAVAQKNFENQLKLDTQGLNHQRVDLEAEAQRRAAANQSVVLDANGRPIVNRPLIAAEAARARALDEAKSYKPTWGVIKEDTDPDSGLSRKTYGWIDPNNKVVTDASGRPLQSSSSSTPPGPAPGVSTDGKPLTGEEFLSTITPQRAETARMIGDYQESPSDLPTRGGVRARAVADAKKYNRDYNEQNYYASQAAYKNFSAGQEGRVVRSLNVATDHLETLRQAATALKNGQLPVLNKIVNTYREQTGSPLTTNFDSIKQAVSSEIAKVVVGGQTALADRDEMANRAKNADSPEQLYGIFDQFTKLMAGQMKGLKRQYESSTYRKDFDKWLLPSTQKSLAAVSKDVSSNYEGDIAPKEGEHKQFKQGWGVYRDGKWQPDPGYKP